MLEFFSPSVDFVVSSNFNIFLLAVISIAESIFLPLPPDIFLIPLSLLNPKLGIFYAAVATTASIFGGLIGYYIGNKGGKAVVYKFISEERLMSVKQFYNKYDVWAILIAAFSPLPYKIFTISAGLFDLNLRRFFLASLVGRGARFFLIGTLIFIFGPSIKKYLANYFEVFTIFVILLLVGGFVSFNFIFKKKSR
jgi:membrane protein YqaA with SNARE-associated domain